MSVFEAIDRACADVGIVPPAGCRAGAWVKTDTLSGRNGKGDGRVMVNDEHVVAWNWQTGEKSTVWVGDRSKPVDRRKMVAAIKESRKRQEYKAREAAAIAARLVAMARPAKHPYLAVKGFRDEKTPVIAAAEIRALAGAYLVPDGSRSAIVVPARLGATVTSAQLIWEDGTKKFLAGGEMGGAVHRIAAGARPWFCEGYATGLTLRAALRAMNRRDAVICCFSASNLATVAKDVRGLAWIVADNDKAMEQFGGLGTGEHWAKVAGLPYAMPPLVGDDINDLHMRDGLFAVQRLLGATIRGVRTR